MGGLVDGEVRFKAINETSGEAKTMKLPYSLLHSEVARYDGGGLGLGVGVGVGCECPGGSGSGSGRHFSCWVTAKGTKERLTLKINSTLALCFSSPWARKKLYRGDDEASPRQSLAHGRVLGGL